MDRTAKYFKLILTFSSLVFEALVALLALLGGPRLRTVQIQHGGFRGPLLPKEPFYLKII